MQKKDPLYEQYIQEVKKYPLLSAEEERELCSRIRQGDQESRDRMITANLKLVIREAYRLRGKGISLPDLIQEGTLGLMSAVKDYDGKTRFSTYALPCIRGYMYNAWYRNRKCIRIPKHILVHLPKWIQASEELKAKLRAMPSPQEIARYSKSKTSPGVVWHAQRVYQVERLDSDGRYEHVKDQRARNALEDISRAEEIALFLQALDTLPTRELLVLEMRHGLRGNSKRYYGDIGKLLHLSRMRVMQIEKEAREKLKRVLKRKLEMHDT